MKKIIESSINLKGEQNITNNKNIIKFFNVAS